MSIYLDYSATTPVAPEVNKAMFDWQASSFGNPSSPHRPGQKSKIKLEEIRDLIAIQLQCLSKEITFTSGGTEANNMAIIGTAMANKEKGQHIIVSSIEHPSVLNSAKYLEKNGFDVSFIAPEKSGQINPEKIAENTREDTILVSVMYVNNETGVINNIASIGNLCRQKGIIIHCDAVQAFGKLSTNVQDLNVDLLSFSGHKIYGPKGVGGLFIRSGVPIEARTYGGGQESNKRTGTENLTGIVGLGEAVRLMNENKDETETILKMKEYFENELQTWSEKIVIIGKSARRSPYASNISFPGTDNQTLLLNLDMKGVFVSVGSACSSGSIKQSHVLKAMQLKDEIINGAIRFSFGRYIEKAQLDNALDIIKHILNQMAFLK